MNLRPELQVMIETISSTDPHDLAGMLSLVSQVHFVNEYLCYTHLWSATLTHISCSIVLHMFGKGLGPKTISSAFR